MKQKIKNQQKKTEILKKKIKPLIKTQIWLEKNERKKEPYITILKNYMR